ncbi:MAG: hypothetical protein ACF788_12670, partial [Novipirellula sp. JB048]
MIQSNVFRSPMLLLCLVAGLGGALTPPSSAESAAPAADNPETLRSPEVMLGIEGLFRVGCWTGVRIAGDSPPPTRVVTEDGDGVSVAYVLVDEPAGSGQTSGTPRGSAWNYVIPGSEAAPLVIHRARTQPVG